MSAGEESLQQIAEQAWIRDSILAGTTELVPRTSSDETLFTEIIPEPQEGYLPGFVDSLLEIQKNPELLPLQIRAGSLSLERTMKFINESGIGRDYILEQLRENSNFPYMFGPNWLIVLINYFMGFRLIEEHLHGLWIPIAEVHCPELEGCSTEFEYSAERELKETYKITAFGFSGGGGYTKNIANVSSGKIKHGSSQLQVAADARIRLFRNDYDEEVYAVDVGKIYDETRYVGIDVSNFKKVSIKSLKADRNLKRRAADSSVSELIEKILLKRGSTHHFTWEKKFTVPHLHDGLTAFLSIESSLLSSLTYTFTLLSRYEYVFYPVQVGSHVYFVFYEELVP